MRVVVVLAQVAGIFSTVNLIQGPLQGLLAQDPLQGHSPQGPLQGEEQTHSPGSQEGGTQYSEATHWQHCIIFTTNL